jgi:hypothetical protein
LKAPEAAVADLKSAQRRHSIIAALWVQQDLFQV